MMKTSTLLLAALAPAATLLAQDGDGKLLDIDIDVNRTEWYENPWLWVGVAAFVSIVLLIARRPKG